MNPFIQYRSNHSTPHPMTTPGDGKLFIDATDASVFTTDMNDDISAIQDKFGFANFEELVGGNQPKLIGKEIDFQNTTKRLISGASGYIFSTSDGLSVFALVKSGASSGEFRPVLDFGALFGVGYGLFYRRDEVETYGSLTDQGTGVGVQQTVSIATDTGYRRVALIFDFENQQTTYLNNVVIVQDAIDLEQLTDNEIGNFPTRQAAGGPVTLGLQSKTFNTSVRFFGEQLKAIIVYANDLSDINRNRIDKFLQILEAR